jgi:DNA topoisomerase-1
MQDNESPGKHVYQQLQKASFAVADIITRRIQSRPTAPFITSTLQQAAANRLGFAAKRTMLIAQQLYEGIDLGSMGALGLITYMRTDSTFLSQAALHSARHFIEHSYGKAYLPDKPNYYAAAKGDQKPTRPSVRPTPT